MNLFQNKTTLLIIVGVVFSLSISLLWPSNSYAGWVKGYTKKDGTYVNGYWKSNPNGLKYDNYSFDGDWSDAYNDSYFSSSKNYSSDWYKPTWVTQDDYYLGKSFYDSRKNYTNYSYDLYDYDYDYTSDPIYNYTPSYNYGSYSYFNSLKSYNSSYFDYDNYTSPYSSLYNSSYTSPYSSSYSGYTSPYSSLYDYDSDSYNSYTSPYSSYNSSYSSPYSSTYNSYTSPYSSYGSSYDY